MHFLCTFPVLISPLWSLHLSSFSAQLDFSCHPGSLFKDHLFSKALSPNLNYYHQSCITLLCFIHSIYYYLDYPLYLFVLCVYWLSPALERKFHGVRDLVYLRVISVTIDRSRTIPGRYGEEMITRYVMN